MAHRDDERDFEEGVALGPFPNEEESLPTIPPPPYAATEGPRTDDDTGLALNPDYVVDVGKWYEEGMAVMREHYPMFVLLGVLSIVFQALWHVFVTASVVPPITGDVEVTTNTLLLAVLLSILVRIPSQICSTLFNAGMFVAAFTVMRGSMVELGTFFEGFTHHAWRLTKLATVMAVVIDAGTQLFIVPGLYLIVVLMFAVPLCVENPRLGTFKCMTLSIRMVHKKCCGMFLLFITFFAVVIVGFLFCVIGVFLAVPLTMCVIAAAYRDIFGLHAPRGLQISDDGPEST